MKTVVAFGTFDILHPGHIAYLEAAKKLGDQLIVVVARDTLARRKMSTVILGSMTVEHMSPAMNEQDRLRVVRALRCVDQAVLGDRGTVFKALLLLKPDILAIGYDQDAQHPVLKLLEKNGLHPRIVRIRKFGKHRHKSSRIKSRIRSL